MDNEKTELLKRYSKEGALLREEFFANYSDKLIMAAEETAKRIKNGNKILLCGNGGSAADAQHIAGEFVNKFLVDRKALPAQALTTDTSIITAIGNDSSFEFIFSRQIEAYGQSGDVLFAISTSGNSKNVINALKSAKEKNIYTICLTGEGGGKSAEFTDILFDVHSKSTPLIQEVHLACEHMFCHLVDLCLS